MRNVKKFILKIFSAHSLLKFFESSWMESSFSDLQQRKKRDYPFAGFFFDSRIHDEFSTKFHTRFFECVHYVDC